MKGIKAHQLIEPCELEAKERNLDAPWFQSIPTAVARRDVGLCQVLNQLKVHWKSPRATHGSGGFEFEWWICQIGVWQVPGSVVHLNGDADLSVLMVDSQSVRIFRVM